MSRLRADFLLLITAIIWGVAFVAQKTGMNGIGPFGFIGIRFLLSVLIVLPFAIREHKKSVALPKNSRMGIFLLSLVFALAVILQQIGIVTATATNAGFLTGVSVIMVPFFDWWLFRKRLRPVIGLACIAALTGIWLLNGASFASFVAGDWLCFLCAVSFGLHISLIGEMLQSMQRPLLMVTVQYACCAIIAFIVTMFGPVLQWDNIVANAIPILYAGILSGGVAYTLQAIAQQHTPATDAGIILSGESLFAAIAAAIILGERLTMLGWFGCGLILLAILMTEIRLPQRKQV